MSADGSLCSGPGEAGSVSEDLDPQCGGGGEEANGKGGRVEQEREKERRKVRSGRRG